MMFISDWLLPEGGYWVVRVLNMEHVVGETVFRCLLEIHVGLIIKSNRQNP